MTTLLALDLGGRNIKLAIAEKKEHSKSASITYFTQISASTLHEGFYDLGMLLEKKLKEKLSQIGLVLVTSTSTIAYGSLLDGLHEIQSLVVNLISEYNKNASILHISRDGTFHSLDEIDKEVGVNPKNIVKYIDAYWRGGIEMAADIFGFENFVFVDMGSSSCTIIPVKERKIAVDLFENRLISRKHIPIGITFTPIIYFISDVEFHGRHIKLFPYIPAYTSDLMCLIKGEPEDSLRKAKWKVARLACNDLMFLEEDEIKSLANQMYEIFKAIIRTGVTNIVREYFARKEIPLVIAGSAKDVLLEALGEFKCITLGFNNSHNAVGLLYWYLKSVCNCKLDLNSFKKC